MTLGAGAFPALPCQRMLLERLPQTRLIMLAPILSRSRKPIDTGVLQRALEILVAGRASLRTAVFERDGRWVQQETTEGPRVVPVPAERGTLSEVLPAWRDALTALDATRGVSLVACPIVTPRGCHAFGLVVSHMALDGFSLRELERLVGAIYERLLIGKPPFVPRESISALAYAGQLAEARAAGRFDGERAHWEQTVRAAWASRGLGVATSASLQKRIQVRLLDEPTWAHAARAAAAAGATPIDAVWAMTILALQEELELDGLLVHVFAHGRQDPRFPHLLRTWARSRSPCRCSYRACLPRRAMRSRRCATSWRAPG